jgi:hypothetical protein
LISLYNGGCRLFYGGIGLPKLSVGIFAHRHPPSFKCCLLALANSLVRFVGWGANQMAAEIDSLAGFPCTGYSLK